ncbi:MAG: HlyD family secretion protein [Pseudanabaenaceae cyanobacterium]
MNATNFKEGQTKSQGWGSQVFRWLRILIGVGLVGIAGYLLWQRQSRVVSRVGYINGALINIYAPITGTFRLEPVHPGETLTQGKLIGEVINERNSQIEIDIEDMRSRLRLAQSQLQTVNNRLANRSAMYSALAEKANQQSGLDVAFFQANLERSRSELREAEARLELARKEVQRFTNLAREGAVPQQRADQAIAEMKSIQQVVESRRAEIQRNLTSLEATRAGLQIDSARTFSFPEIRMLDLTREINDLEQEKRNLEVTIQNLQREVKNGEKQLQLQRSAVIRNPVDTVVWSVNIRTGALGAHVGAGTLLVQLLDCREVWATALVAEQETRNLRLNQRAEVRVLDGTNRIFKGRIKAIRGGVGRVPVGTDVAVPPSDLVRNEIEVQVSLDDRGAEIAKEGVFCSVGQSVEVSFVRNNE